MTHAKSMFWIGVLVGLGIGFSLGALVAVLAHT